MMKLGERIKELFSASRPILRINAFDGKDEVAASGEALGHAQHGID